MLSASAKSRFFHQLATLLNAGIALDRALTMAGQEGNTGFQQCLQAVSAKISKGDRFAQSLGAYPQYFDAWTVSLVNAGEYSGALAGICERLSVSLMQQHRWRKLYRSVLLLLVRTLGVIALLIAVVLFGQQSFFIKLALALLIFGGLGAIAGLLSVSGRSPGPGLYEKALKLPQLGPILQARSLLYFAELEIPISCNVPLVTALELIRKAMPDPLMAKYLAIASQQVQRGQTISQSLQGRLPAIALQMLRTGEETGHLDTMLHKIGEYYEAELERRLQQLQGILNPLSIVALGGAVVLLGLQLLQSLSSNLPG